MSRKKTVYSLLSVIFSSCLLIGTAQASCKGSNCGGSSVKKFGNKYKSQDTKSNGKVTANINHGQLTVNTPAGIVGRVHEVRPGTYSVYTHSGKKIGTYSGVDSIYNTGRGRMDFEGHNFIDIKLGDGSDANLNFVKKSHNNTGVQKTGANVTSYGDEHTYVNTNILNKTGHNSGVQDSKFEFNASGSNIDVSSNINNKAKQNTGTQQTTTDIKVNDHSNVRTSANNIVDTHEKTHDGKPVAARNKGTQVNHGTVTTTGVGNTVLTKQDNGADFNDGTQKNVLGQKVLTDDHDKGKNSLTSDQKNKACCDNNGTQSNAEHTHIETGDNTKTDLKKEQSNYAGRDNNGSQSNRTDTTGKGDNVTQDIDQVNDVMRTNRGTQDNENMDHLVGEHNTTSHDEHSRVFSVNDPDCPFPERFPPGGIIECKGHHCEVIGCEQGYNLQGRNCVPQHPSTCADTGTCDDGGTPVSEPALPFMLLTLFGLGFILRRKA